MRQRISSIVATSPVQAMTKGAMVLALLWGCARDSGDVIAKIGRLKITERDFEAFLEAYPPNRQSGQSEREAMSGAMASLIESKLLAIAAKQEGFPDDSDLQKRAESMKKRVYHRQYRDTFLKENGGLAADTLREYFKTNLDEFHNDSGKIQTFEEAKDEIVDAILLSKADLDSFYTSQRHKYAKVQEGDTILHSLEEKREEVEGDYLRSYRLGLIENMQDRLFSKYAVTFKKPQSDVDEQALRAFYQANKDLYLRKETYEVYHLESDSSRQLEQWTTGVEDLADFKSRASEHSANQWTRPQSGYIGWIKNGHCLPYGIGMLPSVFTTLDSLAESGAPFSLTAPIENPQTQRWHVFALVGKRDKRVKEFDRVRFLVKQDYDQERGKSIAPEAVLAEFKGGDIRESDVLFLREEIPAHSQKRYTRRSLIEYLLEWELAYREMRAMGLDEQPEIAAIVEKEQDEYWGKIYKDSVVKNTFGLDTTFLLNTFEENKSYFAKDTAGLEFDPVMYRDVAIFTTLEPEDFELEYAIRPDRYMKNDVLEPMENVRYRLFQNLRRQNQKAPYDNLLARLRKKYRVRILDTLYQPPVVTDPTAEFERAQNLHADRKLSDAIQQYQRLRDAFPNNPSLQDSICMGIAQVYVEQEKYHDALAEYRRLLYLFPQSPNNYKAKFMIGFIYAENLKKDPLAVATFKDLLRKWPNCDLADDADWMIRNIESGGALMPVLEDE